MKLKELIKDGCIIKNRSNYEWIVMPSLGEDIVLDNHKDGSEYYYEKLKQSINIYDDNLCDINGERCYDIMQISYAGEVIWERTE